mmetsp:Transcript_69556/g.123013  ORF Transcript_69556/g.123013 Transcript_69556/m.123013 type:complete len:1504 (-) Transcript_69556:56-4567(-)
MQTRPAERSAGAAALEQDELIKAIYWGDVRPHEGIKLWRRSMRPPRKERPQRASTSEADGELDPNSPDFAIGGSANQTVSQEEVILNRATDALLEAYRRLTRPDKVGKKWSSERWAAFAQVLAKLRMLASTAGWNLPHPAKLLSKDPKAMAETGMEDAGMAGQAIDVAEGLVDARVLRIAVRLSSETDKDRKGKGARSVLDESWISPEVQTLARIVLTHVRSTGTALERLSDQTELREQVLVVLEEAYGALAAALTSLRNRVGKEAHKMLAKSQDPLWSAAKAAVSLGHASPSAAQAGGPGWAAMRAKAEAEARKKPLEVLHDMQSVNPLGLGNKQRPTSECVNGDTFTPLHQATLLASISSLAEISLIPPGGAKTETETRVQRLLDAIIHSPDGTETWNTEEDLGNEDDQAQLEEWRMEFTSSQLRAMRRSVEKIEPKVHGAQALLRDTLNGYACLAEALGISYSSEKKLRASPPELTRHHALIDLVGKLQGVWRDAGALLTTDRQADLVAMEKVRTRHQKLVQRAYRAGGHEVAAIVLSRLALVDEMLLPASERRLTGEIPWAAKRPYQLCQAVVSGIRKAGEIPSRRRRRWLRCPHESLRVVLAGEVWRQLMQRYLSIDSAFESINACSDMPLTLREFRVAACFMEISLNERLAGLVYEVTSDFTPGSHEATIYGLQRLMQKHGPRGCGTWAHIADAAAVQVRMDAEATAAAERDAAASATADKGGRPRRQSFTSLNAAGATPAVAVSPKDKDKSKAVPMVCPRCLRGELPNFPYVSVGELNRQFGVGGVSMDSSGSKKSSKEGSPQSSKNGSTSSANSASSGGFESSSDESEVPEPDLGPQAGLELAEDHILAWATSVLADNVILCKDERGAYFRWLARIVLYDTNDEFEDKEQAKADPRGGSSQGRRPGSKAGGSVAAPAAPAAAPGRRMSFASALSAAIPRFTEEQAQERPGTDGGRKPSQAEPAAGAVQAGHPPVSQDVGDVAAQAMSVKKANQAAARRRADEKEQVAEAERDAALILPDSHLAVMRVDLGVTASSEIEGEGRIAGLDEKDRLRKLGKELCQMFYSNVEHQKARRAEREVKMIKELRSLGTAEPELRMLERGFQAVAEAPPNAVGAVLVGGAAQAAQRILIPHPGARKLVERGVEQDDAEELSRALEIIRKKNSNGPSSGVVPAAAAEVQRVAQEMKESSSTHASHCYGRAGYEDEAKKSRVAVALRLLEHDLFAAPEPGGTAAEEDSIERVVPLLLTKQTAQRLLKQARWEEELAAQSDQLVDNKEGATVERRKARIQHKATRETPDSTDSESDGARSDQADSGVSNRPKRGSEQKLPTGLQRGPGPPSSPSSRSPTPSRSKPRTPVLQAAETTGAEPTSAVAAQQVVLEAHTNLNDWHPSILRLFNNVDRHGESVRFTTRGAGFQNRGGNRGYLSRSASDSAVSPLPSVQDHASPRRGGQLQYRQGRRVKKDLVLVEGWRAKMASTPDVMTYGHSPIPRVERES